MALPPANRALTFCLIMLLGLLWGMTYALNKVALTSIPPLTLVTARVVIAATALWIVVGLRRCERPAWRRVGWTMIVQGCLACLIPYALIAISQQTVDSALAAILNSSAPLLVCLIRAGWPGREPLTAEHWLGSMLGLAGVVLIMGIGTLAGLGQSLAGQAAILVATAASAVGVVYGRRLDHLAPEVSAVGTLTAAALLLVPLCLSLEAPLRSTPSWTALAALLLNALGATALGFVVYFRLMRTVGSFGTASVGFLKPVVGVLIGCAVLAEPLTIEMALGLLAILVGLVVIHDADRRWLAFSWRAVRRRYAARTT
jgi:drug/metabolite transporter (DMT)-like permease